MVHFVGAGPGDPELLTLKALKLLQEADLVVYTGSLINPAVLEYAAPEARLVNSAPLELDEICDLLINADRKGQVVVRLHTGDPSLYGAIGEQMARLDQAGLDYEVVPGVSSFAAAAASLRREYTVPEICQTVIITRMEGRTPVPEREKLSNLAGHQSSMAIFLSVSMAEEVTAELLVHYPPQTPVAVVERASWPEERCFAGCLEDLDRMIRDNGITRTALILVGEFLQAQGLSRLYARGFEHGARTN